MYKVYMGAVCGRLMEEMQAVANAIARKGAVSEAAPNDWMAAEEEKAVKRFRSMSMEDMRKMALEYGEERMRQERFSEIP